MSYEIQFYDVWRNFDRLLWGAWLTLRLSGIAMLIGLAVGISLTFLRSVYPRVFSPIVETYVQVIRNTPFLVQIFLVYFGLPSLGIRLGANEAGVIALVVNVGAYASEIIRAGVESVGRGQVEAGLSLGLRRRQVFWLIVLMPALRTVYPALTTQFILLMLTSSALCVISAEELTAIANTLSSQTFRTIEVYFVVAGLYLAMAMGFSLLFHLIGKAIFPQYDSAQQPRK